MLKRKSTYLVFLATQLFAVVANADIIDQGDTTLDTATGLEWLDMSYTDGKSASQVLSELDNYLGGGWRYATVDAVDKFVTAITGQSLLPDSLTVNNWSAAYQGNTDAVAQYVGYSANPNFEYVYGLTQVSISTTSFGRYLLRDGNDDPQVKNWDFRKADDSNLFGSGFSSSFYASWLVRESVSVPEPGTLALLGIGLAGMGLARRRKNA
jgi:hypothetical protein